MWILLLFRKIMQSFKELVIIFTQLPYNISLQRISAHLLCPADIGQPEAAVFKLLAHSGFFVEAFDLVL